MKKTKSQYWAMAVNDKKYLRNAILFICLLFQFTNIQAQNPDLNIKISVKADNENIIDILETIKGKSGLKFSYSRDIIQENIIKSVNEENIPVKQLLEILLKDTGLDYKIVEGQVIIYRPKQISVPENSKLNIITIYDTLISLYHDTTFSVKYDTLTITDHITHHDTITWYDTIKIEKKNPVSWSVGIHGGPAFQLNKPGTITLTGEQTNEAIEINRMPLLSYSIGTNIDIQYKHLLFQPGIEYYNFREKIECFLPQTEDYYEYSGGFWDKKLVDTYFKWNGTDTTWYEITDSSWVPLDSTLISGTGETANKPVYSSANRYSIIEFPIRLGYKWNKHKLSFSIIGGIVPGIIINTKGNIYSNNIWTEITKDMLKNFQLSVSGAINIGYKITDSFILSGEIDYRNHFIPVFSDNLKISHKPEFIALKVGMKYHFN